MMLEIPSLTYPESQMPLATRAETFSLEECSKVQKEPWIFSHNKFFHNTLYLTIKYLP